MTFSVIFAQPEPLSKVFLLLAAVISTHIGITPPNAPPSTQERSRYTNEGVLGDLAWRVACLAMKYFLWASTLFEIALLLAKYEPPLLSNALVFLVSNPYATRVRITPSFLAGCAITCIGGFLRRWSYITLGRLYTWELSVRHNHSLITSGPYAIVRHPGYLGITMLSIGNLLMWLESGSWWIECGLLMSVGGMAVGVAFATFWITIAVILLMRIGREDAVMSKEFRNEWHAWAKRTPYKVIPFIY